MPTQSPSLEPSGDAVKKTRLGRIFEGWQLGAMASGLVLAAALLAVPRAVRPELLPVPLIDVTEDCTARARDRELAERARARRLPFETRAVGDAVRRFGRARATGGNGEHELGVLSERVAAALAAGQTQSLLELRALQAELFVAAVRAQDFAKAPSAELAALGGDFTRRAQLSGWVQGGACVASDDELRTLFALRFVELTGLRDVPGFRPTLPELRRYYRFLLLYPEAGAASADGASAQRQRALARLRYVAALSRRDPDYPAQLARGVLLAELGAAAESAEAFTAHLSRSTGALWMLRARNYLLGVSGELGEEP